MNDQKTQGRKYWQSLNHLADTPQMQASISQEFNGYDPEQLVNRSRRKFLKLAGASMALAGVTLTGCRRWPKENVVDQNSRPIGRIPGIPEQYATVWELGGVGQPLLITTYDGRPIKVDGNPMHPSCATFGGRLGSSTVLAQASLLEMYDPERSRGITQKQNNVRQPVDVSVLKSFVGQHFASMKGAGDKLAVLIEETRSPSVAAAMAAFRAYFPAAKVYEYEPLSRDNDLVASKSAFGVPARQLLNLQKAQVIVSFDADLFGAHPDSLRLINDWAQNRKTADSSKTMNRLYMVESRYSLTGSNADERLPATVRDIEQMVLELAHRAGLESGQAGLSPPQVNFVDAIWDDLQKNQGAAVLTGGVTLRPEILGVIAAINDKLGAFGNTITMLPEVDRPTHADAIKALVDSINSGGVETLVLLGGNPCYDAPADLGFEAACKTVKTTVQLSLYHNETTEACVWHVNRAHYLESWGDATMYDGSVGIQQPTIEPLFGGKTIAEVLFLLAGEDLGSQDILYRVWGQRLNEPFVATSKALQKVLHDGFVAGTPEPLTLKNGVARSTVSFDAAPEVGTFELRFAADYKTYDGRFANNGWLQECPDPITKICWDNAAFISYADALTLGVKQRDHDQDVIKIEVNGKELLIPAVVVPGHPKGVITLPLGYARRVAGAILLTDNPGSIGFGIGHDTYSLRTSHNLWTLPGAKVTNTFDRMDVATTAGAYVIDPLGFDVRKAGVGGKEEGGMIVHESTLAAYVKNPDAPHNKSEKLLPLQLFPAPYHTPPKRPGGPEAFNEPHAWGMTIDMNACVGCNACVVACQAENNVPIVGKEEVIVTRAMHWLRIDRYFKSEGKTYEENLSDPNPEITYQPMMCVHCENAPCEQVCPVAATVHDAEGLNTMVYNRCIGTRYCANNCPYKVRRFNYLDYQSRIPGEWRKPWLGIPDTQQEESVDKIKALVFNPEVTVRMRGVMEKCTYCVQRIKNVTNHRRIEWLNGQRDKVTVDDFDVVTACQTACPAEAIVFGNLNDSEALVSKLQEGARSYQVLQELNNRPRTQHLAKLRNPVHEMATGGEETA